MQICYKILYHVIAISKNKSMYWFLNKCPGISCKLYKYQVVLYYIWLVQQLSFCEVVQSSSKLRYQNPHLDSLPSVMKFTNPRGTLYVIKASVVMDFMKDDWAHVGWYQGIIKCKVYKGRWLGQSWNYGWSAQHFTHWGRDKMVTVSQTTLSNAFSWMKMLKFWLKFHWSLFRRGQSTIFKHWFR